MEIVEELFNSDRFNCCLKVDDSYKNVHVDITFSAHDAFLE